MQWFQPGEFFPKEEFMYCTRNNTVVIKLRKLHSILKIKCGNLQKLKLKIIL